ncbi:B12-binding domain-containing radical SAM protein [Desulforhopalus sp. 52FAK]
MEMIDFEQGPIRPPTEADSLLIRTTRGCPWNKCSFCTLFQGAHFSIRSVDDIKRDIIAAKHYYNGAPIETCFLQDGDSFVMGTDNLIEVLSALKDAFPSLKRISSYGRAQTMMRKSAAEMQEICDAGLNMLYSGLESGSAEVLKKVRKGTTPEDFIESSRRAKQAGMKMMVFVILGLGGKELSKLHVEGTIDVLNQVDPCEIRNLTLGVKDGTGLAQMIDDGNFTLLSEVEMIEEEFEILSKLTGINSHFRNFHSVDLLPEVDGTLPGDKAKLMATLKSFLSLPEDEQNNFILGRRLGYYAQLSDLGNISMQQVVEQHMEKITSDKSIHLESVFHDLRKKMI